MCGAHFRPRVGGSESNPRLSENILIALANLTVNDIKYNMDGMERPTIPSGIGHKVTREDVEKVRRFSAKVRCVSGSNGLYVIIGAYFN